MKCTHRKQLILGCLSKGQGCVNVYCLNSGLNWLTVTGGEAVYYKDKHGNRQEGFLRFLNFFYSLKITLELQRCQCIVETCIRQ